MRIKIFMVVFIFLLAGCSPAVRITKFQHLPPKPFYTSIKIFRFKTPLCNFEEIGIVHSRQRNKLISMDKVMDSLKVAARKMGGDAIMGLHETNPIHNVSKYGIDNDPVLSGTVIKFTDPNCTQ